jgi:hypothetical protein
MVNEIAGVELHLMHRQWLGASEAVSSPAAAIATTTVTNVSWTSTLTPVVGVLSLQLTGFNSSTMSIQPIPGGYLLGASNQAPGGVLPLQVIEAETLATGAFTSVADSTNLARGGSVLRYTPTGTAQIVANEVALSSPGLAQAQMINVFACVRINYYTRTRSRQVWSTPVVVELATNTPTIIPLGMVASRNGHALFDLAVQAIDTGGTLDIDYIAIQNVDDPGAYVAQWGVTSTTTYAASTALALAIEDRSLTELNPTVAMVNTSGTADYTYIDQYTSMYLPTVGNVAYLLLLMPYSNYWRVPNGVAAAQIGFSASRRPVYLSPQ